MGLTPIAGWFNMENTIKKKKTMKMNDEYQHAHVIPNSCFM
jgi:hypothetical protein